MRTYAHHDFMAEGLDDEAFSGVSYSLFSGLSGNGVHTHFLRSLFARTGNFKTFCRSNVLLYEYLSIDYTHSSISASFLLKAPHSTASRTTPVVGCLSLPECRASSAVKMCICICRGSFRLFNGFHLAFGVRKFLPCLPGRKCRENFG